MRTIQCHAAAWHGHRRWSSAPDRFIPTPPCLQAKYGDDAVKQLQERKQREAELASDKVDVNLIPLGARVRWRSYCLQRAASIVCRFGLYLAHTSCLGCLGLAGQQCCAREGVQQ